MGTRENINSPPALLLIDHGSRYASANRNLDEIAELLRKRGRFPIVIAAHMELAHPTIAEGLQECLAAGAEEVVILPYFLAPGRHSAADIPRLVAEALPPGAATRVAIAEPFGIHEGLLEAALQRAEEALAGRSASARRAPGRLRRDESVLLVVDIQARLLPHIFNRGSMTGAALYVIECLKRLRIPMFVTEQYPAGLGPTAPAIAQALPEGAKAIEKTAFSSFGATALQDALPTGRKALLLCGMETHVCVLQTALDALEAGWQVAAIADAMGSRRESDHLAALERLRQAGAILATAEMAVFELLRGAGTPEFKELQAILKAGPEAFAHHAGH